MRTVVLVLGLAMAAWILVAQTPPEQPIPYSHKHVMLGEHHRGRVALELADLALGHLLEVFVD